MNKEIFKNLSMINVNEHTESKNGLTYLSWTWAWSKIKEVYPDADYEIEKFENNLPYVYDENTGYMVFTKVKINDDVKEMWLPVMDGNNKAMLNRPYEYQVKEYKDSKWTGNYTKKIVDKATMFDINKTIMRCLVKNLAMFGLGIYIYSGEDYPDGYEMSKDEAEKIIINFGKHSGKTLKEIKETDSNYLQWLLSNDNTSESLKNAISLLIKTVTDEDVDTSNLPKKEVKSINQDIKLVAEFNDILIKSGTDLEKLKNNYGVKNTNELTNNQLAEAIKIMAMKIEPSKKEVF
jgi:hypothetical protein